MKRILWLVSIVAAGVLAGCAGTPKQAVLGDLGELDIEIDTTSVITDGRNKAMDNYWEFMAGAKQESRKVEAMQRLADLELERSDERFQKQMEVFVQGGAEDDADLDMLRKITYRSAIKLYEDALRVAKGEEQRVSLLYPLSKTYEQAGQVEKVLDTLRRLLALEAGVDNRDELHFRRGEMLFALQRYKPAEQAYAQVLKKGPGSRYFEKAMVQRGWALYKQEKYQGALRAFFGLVDRKLQSGAGIFSEKKLSRGEEELVDDVFRVAVLSFNELGGPAAIKSFFKGAAHRDYEVRLYKGLAEFYVKQGRVRDAAITYHTFAAEYPMHEQAYEFDLKAIAAYTDAGFSSVLMAEKKAFIKKYRVNGSYWQKFEDQEETVLVRLKLAMSEHSEDVVRHAHAEAQNVKTFSAYQQAFVWYRKHLKWFGQNKNGQKLNFLYAELLFEAGNFEKAAEQFERTAYQYLRFGKNAEAGYAALLSYAKAEKQVVGKKKLIWSRLAVGSALRFGKTFPDDKRSAEVMTKAAQDMFALKKYAQAAVAARQILEISSGGKVETRRTAWKIIARAEFEKGDYTRAEVAYKVALSLMGKSDKGQQALNDGLAAAVYKQGEYMKSKGNLQGAIAQFSRVEQVSPDSSVVVSAEYDIAVSLLESGKWTQSIEVFSTFRQKNPGHQLAGRVSKNLIKAYLAMDLSAEAAGELEIMSAAHSDFAVKREAIWQAAELYAKAGVQEKVISTYKYYIEKFSRPMAQAMEARNRLAMIYGKTGQLEDRRYWLKEIVQRDKNAEAASTPRTQYLAAKAAFELALPTLKSYQRIKLVRPLKKSLKRKKQRMKEAVAAYTLAADYGIAEVTTASVYWLAEIYNEFGQELMSSERPPSLSEDELEQYDILLEEQAYPFEEKSINIHESNMGRVSEGMYDEWMEKSLSKLKVLNPIRYAKPERSEAVSAYIY